MAIFNFGTDTYNDIYERERKLAVRGLQEARGLVGHQARHAAQRAKADLRYARNTNTSPEDYFQKMYEGNWDSDTWVSNKGKVGVIGMDRGVNDHSERVFLWEDERGSVHYADEKTYLRLKAEREGRKPAQSKKKILDPIEALRARVLDRLSDVELPTDLCSI